jgi:hypothetical protein
VLCAPTIACFTLVIQAKFSLKLKRYDTADG